LPDFSWRNVPKWRKYGKWPQNVSNRHKIYQNFALRGLSKCTKIWNENLPSGNPGRLLHSFVPSEKSRKKQVDGIIIYKPYHESEENPKRDKLRRTEGAVGRRDTVGWRSAKTKRRKEFFCDMKMPRGRANAINLSNYSELTGKMGKPGCVTPSNCNSHSLSFFLSHFFHRDLGNNIERLPHFLLLFIENEIQIGIKMLLRFYLPTDR
jgi:hypothetical protein